MYEVLVLYSRHLLRQPWLKLIQATYFSFFGAANLCKSEDLRTYRRRMLTMVLETRNSKLTFYGP